MRDGDLNLNDLDEGVVYHMLSQDRRATIMLNI